LAGDDAAYQALFDRYGVQRVRDMDELATALILFAELERVGQGGLVSLHDSGGERQLMVDLADEHGVPLVELGSEAVARIEACIDPELPAVNPLDAWSRGGPDAAGKMTRSLAAMMDDPNTAIGVVVHDDAHAVSAKPVVLVAARQGTGYDEAVLTSTAAGFPVLDGVPGFLRGVRALFDYRDFLNREPGACAAPPAEAVERWRAQLGSGTLSEANALAMLGEFGLPVVPVEPCNNEDDATCRQYPAVLKTAEPGIAHKSDVGGVVLGIETGEQLRAAYRDMASRLGPAAIIAPMAAAGIEMLLGARTDPQFGPVVLLGFGGIHAQTLQDVAFALPPFSAGHAKRCLDELKLRPLLDGKRGAAAADVDAYCQVAAAFSSMVDALRDDIREIDINPVIVHASGCTVVDALVIA
jgi:acyl-CoA synthetase (NDP forming)